MKQALRRLGRDRWFAMTAVMVQALGIGSVTAVFSIVNGVLLQPLPYTDPGRLYVVQERAPKLVSQYPAIPVNASHFNDWRKSCGSCEQLALLQPSSMNLTGDGEPERIGGVRSTAQIFAMLGSGARLGRVFTDEEDRPDGPNVAVISDSLWRRRFGANPGVLGRTVRLDERPYEIIGVLPAAFHFPRGKQLSGLIGFPERADVFVPAAVDYAKVRAMGNFNFAVLIRLRPGAAPERAVEEMSAPLAQIGREAGIELKALATPLKEMVIGKTDRVLWLLLATVGAVLLIVCVNLGNLMLARAHGRLRESAIRRALGASGRQVCGPMMIESAVLATAGGALGILVAWAGLRALIASAPVDLPRLEEVRVDALAVGFAFLASAVCATLFGVLPALRMARSDPQDALKSSSHTITAGGGRLRARKLLVALETSLSAALLVIAGLLGGSFSRVMQAERGFDVQNILAADISLPDKRYRDGEQRSRFQQALLQELAQIPGVRYAGISNMLPLRGEIWVNMIRKQGSRAPVWELPVANLRFVNPAFFNAMGIPLRAGRFFTEGDRGRKVAVMSESAARRIWPGENAVGQHLSSPADLNPKPEDLTEIIGVVADVRTTALDKAPVPVCYTPYWQDTVASTTFVVRTSMEPSQTAGALRAAVRRLDPELPVAKLATMQQILEQSVGQRKFQTILGTAFSAAALLLACLGIYGVVSYTVARRTPEMGIRMAFGASRGAVSFLIMRQEMAPVAAGLAAGIGMALAAGKWLGSMLYGVSPKDPTTIALVSCLLLGASALACWAPARRAARMNVLRALRYE
jgi:predicted permease